jgi:putative hemolysin
MTLFNIFLILLLVALNAFFVSVEFAAIASRRSRLDLMAGADSQAARIVRSWLEQPASRDRLIAASQLGITVVSLALGAVGENAFEAMLAPLFQEAHFPPWLSFLEFILPALPLVFALVVVTSIHVVLGEQVPKVAVLRAPERFALFSAPLMNVFNAIFKWFINLLDWLTHLILGLFGLQPTGAHSLVYSLEEIKEMVNGPEVAGVIEKPEREMLSAILDFGAMYVRQVGIPRTEIIAVEASSGVSEVIQIAAEHGVTKLPVYEDNLDQIIGVIHLRDLLKLVNNLNEGRTARDLVREALFIPETTSVNDLLREFRARHTHIAIVLDEYGGTAGMVTLEDLLDEIIGEVQDTFDTDPPPIQMMTDGTALIEGMELIEEINDHFGLALSDPDYDTLAGYILGKLGHIPKVGDVVEDRSNHILLKVEKMDRLRIAQVLLKKI